MKVRIKFAKHGPTKYIGHLDMMRYFQKCMRKSEVDIKYSGGFSPHQIMSFAHPLGVGMETDGDYFDIEMSSYPGDDAVKDALNNVMVPGVEILKVCMLPDDAKNAMASVAAASYSVTGIEGYRFPQIIIDSFNSFASQKEILYTKVTKKNMLEIDLKPHIYEMKIDDEQFTCTVDASSAGNIKSTQILEKLYEYAGENFDPLEVQVTRLETYQLVNNGLKPLI